MSTPGLASRTKCALRQFWPDRSPSRGPSMRLRRRCMPCNTKYSLRRAFPCRASDAKPTDRDPSSSSVAPMPFVTVNSKRSDYDVIVVGSGAAGGQSAYTLCMEGARVLMLEAGRKYSPENETPMFQTPDLAPLVGVATSDKPFGFYDATIDGGWEVPGEPYVRASEEYGARFDWWRPRMLGGRTNHWGRISLRNGPYDFKPYTRDGLGFDWPISYEDMAPYYDKVEMLIGVYGANDGLENTPNSPDGVLLPPPKPRVSDLLIADR